MFDACVPACAAADANKSTIRCSYYVARPDVMSVGVIVKSQDDQHPFHISAHMTGCATLNRPSDCRGDPELVNVIPGAAVLEFVCILHGSDPGSGDTTRAAPW